MVTISTLIRATPLLYFQASCLALWDGPGLCRSGIDHCFVQKGEQHEINSHLYIYINETNRICGMHACDIYGSIFFMHHMLNN